MNWTSWIDFVSFFHATVYFDTFFWIPIRSTILVHGSKLYDQPRNKGVAEYLKNRIYINSGASIHVLFNKELLGGIVNLNRALKIHADDKPIHLSQIGSLHQALWHLPLLVSTYHYSENTIAKKNHFQSLPMIITSSVTHGLTTQYMCRARMMVNTYDFKETISSTYTTWTLAKLTGTSIVISILWNKEKYCIPYLIKREQKQLESYKNAAHTHPTKISSTHWSITL